MLIFLLFVSAIFSSVMNNTPIIIIIIPLVSIISEKLGFASSKALIPLSYAGILGGMTTLVGSSTNIIGAGVARDLGIDNISFFSITIPGLAIAIPGLIFVSFLLPKLMPKTNKLSSSFLNQEQKFMAQNEVSENSDLIGEITKNGQFDKLKNNPYEIMPTFIDETIRWVTPVRHFMRTATQDYLLRDTEIKEGDSLILWYPSANRDEEVFDSPFNFKVDRNDTSHIAFGFGSHVCLGQHLAKMEMSILFEKLINQLDHIELAGEPQYTQSTFVGGLKSLPIRYRMKK